MKQLIAAAAFMGLLFSAQAAEAQCRHNNANKRMGQAQYQQKQRIRQGFRNGQLTRGEMRNLSMQQSKINHYKRMAKADGFISPRERGMIRREQAQANRNIYRQRHDGQMRNGFRK